MAILNLILAGILLALAYERFERLWFPIGIHFLWNILSGPILGYGVNTANLLRLWQAQATESFDFQAFNLGDYLGAVHEKIGPFGKADQMLNPGLRHW